MVFACFAILTASGLFGLRASIFHLMTLVWQGYAIASCEESGEWELALDRHPANSINQNSTSSMDVPRHDSSQLRRISQVFFARISCQK